MEKFVHIILKIILIWLVTSASWAARDACTISNVSIEKIRNFVFSGSLPLVSGELHIHDLECIDFPEGLMGYKMQEAFIVVRNEEEPNFSTIIEIGNNWNCTKDCVDNERLVADKIFVIRNDKIPYLQIVSEGFSATRLWQRLHIFRVKPNIEKIETINMPVSVADITNGQGSDHQIIGLYYNDKNELNVQLSYVPFLERHKCNACKKWKIKTLKFTDKGLIRFDKQ